MRFLNYLALIQGFYYLATGIWPLVHYASFEAITGPKTDVWLVKTVGIVVIAIGISILSAVKDPKFPVIVLGTVSAVGLSGININYVLNGSISWIYLTDAIVEILLVISWIAGFILRIGYGYKKV